MFLYLMNDMTDNIKLYYGGNKRTLKYNYKQLGGNNEGERLIVEIINRDLEEVKKILQESSNSNQLVNYQNSDGLTPLVFAFKEFENQGNALHSSFIEKRFVPYSYLLIHNIINVILGYDVNPNLAPHNGWGNDVGDIYTLSPLHQACYYNLETLVDLLLEKGANPNVIDIDGDTPLHLCVNEWSSINESSLNIISSLVILGTSYGTNLNESDMSSLEPDTAKNVISANINQRNNSQQTPLYVAAKHGFSEGVKKLLEYKAVPDTQDHTGRTPLLVALENWLADPNPEYYNRVIANLLGDEEGNSADPNLEVNVMGHIHVPLYLACGYGNADAARLLILHGAKVNIQIPEIAINSPLLVAINNGYPEIVRILLENGANPDLKLGLGGNHDAMGLARDRVNEVIANNMVTNAHPYFGTEQIVSSHLARRDMETSLVDQMSRSPNGIDYPADIYNEIKGHFGGRKRPLLKYIGGMNNPNINSTPSDSDSDSESENSAITVAVESHRENLLPDDIENLLPDDINLMEAVALLDSVTISNNESERNSTEYLRREIIERFGLRAILLLGFEDMARMEGRYESESEENQI